MRIGISLKPHNGRGVGESDGEREEEDQRAGTLEKK